MTSQWNWRNIWRFESCFRNLQFLIRRLLMDTSLAPGGQNSGQSHRPSRPRAKILWLVGNLEGMNKGSHLT